jgi:hypothetical protein
MKNLLIILAITLFWGCSEEIPLDITSSTKIVANCLLCPDSTQELTLVHSKTLNDGGIYYDAVDSATAILYKDDVLVGNFAKTGSRTWTLVHYPLAGSTYQLKIAIPGYDTLYASTTMPTVPSIVKTSATQYKKGFNQQRQAYNQWVFGLNAIFDSTWWINPNVVPEIKLGDKLQSTIATNHPNADGFNQDGNLDDLIGSAASLPAYEFYIRLLASDSEISFDIEAAFGPYCFVVFRNASNEYDQYLKTSLQKMLQYADEDDPIQWFDENVVYSNIKNGTGIFGAYTDQVFCYGNIETPEK